MSRVAGTKKGGGENAPCFPGSEFVEKEDRMLESRGERREGDDFELLQRRGRRGLPLCEAALVHLGREKVVQRS